jgi:hypothetical protein
MEHDIPDNNLFMMCEKLNSNAITELCDQYHFKTCKREELDIWKEIPFDDKITA